MNSVDLNVKILYYPLMGTRVSTERIILLAKLCYSPIGPDQLQKLLLDDDPRLDEEAARFARHLVQSGHHGALEHWYTTFAVEGFSRISSQQLDRHRIIKIFKDADVYVNEPLQASVDFSQLQQSQRYVREEAFRFIVPESISRHPDLHAEYLDIQERIRRFQIKGKELDIPAEDLRFALSGATETRFVVTTNARQLRHIFNLRCCTRAQWEIRRLFETLLAEYKKIAPNIFYRSGASCDELGYCTEGRFSCGRAPTREEMLGRV
ncbi:MAG: FAD-dependent thymidylate synthase [Bacillota bacterium]